MAHPDRLRRVSRRDFIKFSGFGALAFLAGCNAAPTPASAPIASPPMGSIHIEATTVAPVVVSADTCGSIPMIDYSQALSPEDLYKIDVGGPDQYEVLNLWIPGEKERTYVVDKMEKTLRSKFLAYGNKRIYHEKDCDWHNLVQEAVTYAKNTTDSNHTGEVWEVLRDGSTKLLIPNAFLVTPEQLAKMKDSSK